MELSADNAMREYADKNLTYKEISEILTKYYGIHLSPNAIGKTLKREGMPSRKGPTTHSINQVKMAIQSLIPALPYTVGYRQMTDVMQQMNMHVRRDTVMKVLRELDPTGVEYRRRRRIQRKVYRTQGPNYVWHVDAFSRKIMWLNVGSTNNDPAVIAHNFVTRVEELKANRGMVEYDETPTERWWISFFKDLELFGAFYRGNDNHLRCIRYCFMPVLQRDLDYLMERWNNHYISRSRQAICPNGRPNVLYMTPEEKGFGDYKHPVTPDDIDFAFSQCKHSERTGSPEFDLRIHGEFQVQGWNDAQNWETALQQYFHIINVLRN